MTITAPDRTGATPAPAAPAPLALPSGAKPLPALVLPDRTRALGTYLFMVADAMMLAAIVAAYFAVKDGSSAWPPVDVGVGTYIPFVVTLTLTMAAASAQWAVRSMRANDQRNVGIALLFAAFLGLATANAEWAAFDKAGFGVADHAYGTFYYLLIGFHLAHLVAALVLLLLLAGRSMAGHFSADHHDPLRSGVLYFQYTNAVWYAVFTVIFVMSRVHG
ncbi:MAG TPA: cytochrome c oxidase subunit 3 [Acidimicrobiales bacterium]|nr:cytochrome c oxidase subunit 3 [Acidimicrobiales bacterium]